MKQLTIYITEKQHTDLKLKSIRKGKTVTDILRELIDSYLKLKGGAGS